MMFSNRLSDNALMITSGPMPFMSPKVIPIRGFWCCVMIDKVNTMRFSEKEYKSGRPEDRKSERQTFNFRTFHLSDFRTARL